MNNSKSSSTKLLREVEELRKKLSEAGSPLNNNEIWSIQQALQVTCGHLLITFQEIALEKGIERDLWNFGFRTTITQLQSEAREKKKGSNDAKDLLHWFLNAASGFYLQLVNQICSVNSLDLVFRRKDSVYGLVGGGLSSTVNFKVKDNVTKNALYLCQYCLIHLGDLARYRHQAKQAETYYRHAVTVAATSGHPYNQLALLEAGRGNRLTSVFLYIRALCVNAPFPGAPSNLIQTLSKVLSSSRSKDEKKEINEIKVGTLTRMTKEEYINLFLHFHSSLFLKGDLEAAKVDLPRLSSALSMLVATTTLTRSSLVQMFAVTVFALHYFSSRFTFRFSDEINKKEEEDKLVDPNECEGSLEVLEESMVGMLAALLLPIHTMKEPEVVITYPALPAIRLMFEWIALEDKLCSAALKKKQQIWPGLCTLINFLQQPLKNFDAEQYKDTPLPEDWDLQEFQPLQKILNRYKYRESSPRLSPEQYSLIRAQRLWDLASKFCQENVEGSAVIKMWTNEEGRTRFEATSNQTPPVEEVLDLERLTLQPRPELASNKKEKKVGILKPQGSLERSKATLPKEHHQPPVPPTSVQGPTQIMKDTEKLILSVGGEKRAGGVGVPFTEIPKLEPSPTVIGKHKTTRTNVALQAILKRNSNTQEMKQVTFQTPSPAASPNPSDDPSTESQRSPGVSTPPLNVAALLPRNPSPASLMPPHPMGLPMPPPSQNQPLPYHQRFPPPFRAMDHPSNTAPPQSSQNFPPSATGTQSYSHGLSPGTHTTRGDQPSYLNIRPSPPKGVFGPGSEEIGSYFPSPPQGLGMIRPPQEQSLFNRTIRGTFDTQPNTPGSSLYGNLPQAPLNWKNSPTDPPLGPSPPQLKNNPNFRGMFNSTRALDVSFKEGGDFQPPNFPLSLQTFPGGKPPKENTSPLTMFMDNGASRGMGNPASPGNAAITHGGNLLQQISSGPSQTGVSNLFQGAQPGGTSPWWNKDTVGAGGRNNNAYQFSHLGLRSSFHGGSVSPPSIDTSIPPPHMGGSSQFPNPGGLAMPGCPPSTAFPSEPTGPLEGNNGSLRMSNTYSLFGPLGGGREPLQQPFPPNNGSAANRMLNPSSKQSVQPQQQFPSPHSLWSGPSPLQRLLEQKKFSTK